MPKPYTDGFEHRVQGLDQRSQIVLDGVSRPHASSRKGFAAPLPLQASHRTKYVASTQALNHLPRKLLHQALLESGEPRSVLVLQMP